MTKRIMEVDAFTLEIRRGAGEAAFLDVRAGQHVSESIERPFLGDTYERTTWTHDFQIYVSPSGRSVRLFLNGDEIELPKGRKL